MAAVRVEPFAARVLHVARALVGAEAWSGVEQWLHERITPPKGHAISPEAMRLLQDTLRSGVIQLLVTRGGWRRRSALAGGEPDAPQRIWQRHRPSLVFDACCYQLLACLVANPIYGKLSNEAPEIERSDEAGYHALLYLLCDRIERSGMDLSIPNAPCWPLVLAARSPLCRLGFPLLFSAWPEPELTAALEAPLDWSELVETPLLLLTEALQLELTQRWVAVERAKAAISNKEHMGRLARAQREALEGALGAFDAAGRRDLADFAVQAGAELLERPRPARRWVASLDNTGTLASRGQARRAAGAFLEQLVALNGWEEEHRAVRHFEEGYAAAQLLMRRWESLGPRRLTHAEEVLRELAAPPSRAASASQPDDAGDGA